MRKKIWNSQLYIVKREKLNCLSWEWKETSRERSLVQNPAQLASRQYLVSSGEKKAVMIIIPLPQDSQNFLFYYKHTFSGLLHAHMSTLSCQFLLSFCSLIFFKIVWLHSLDEKQALSVTIISIKTFRISLFLYLSVFVSLPSTLFSLSLNSTVLRFLFWSSPIFSF